MFQSLKRYQGKLQAFNICNLKEKLRKRFDKLSDKYLLSKQYNHSVPNNDIADTSINPMTHCILGIIT